MPNFPKSKKRPWSKPAPKPQAGRKVTTKFYHTPAWRKFRKEHLTMEPLCRECKLNNRLTPANMVDHIKPINREDPFNTMGGIYGEPLEHYNVQSLCDYRGFRCHEKKSGKERQKK